jgi:integrase
MRKARKFPMAVESLAAWRGKIYESKSRGFTYYKLVYYNGHGRKTLGFDSFDAAMDGVKVLLQQLGQSNGDSLVLSGSKALHYQQALTALDELKEPMPINLAMADYVKAKAILGGSASLREAAEFYVKRRGLNLPERSVSKVVEEMLKAKKDLSPRYVKDLENRLTRFGNDFQIQIADVDAPKLATWLRGLNLSARSRNNFRTSIETLMTFAKSCGYLPRDWDEMESVPREKDRAGAVEIFTAEEVSALLTHANDKLLPFVAIGAFAGLRSAEIERLTWNKVSLQTGYITIDASIAKTNSRRVIPILPNLRAWLTPLHKKQGAVCTYGNVTNELMKLAAAAGVKWKQNALRHSYASYRLADVQDTAKVALEMGNSPAMIFQHYRELVTPEQAKTWFSIEPAAQSNVVPMNQ